MFFEKAIDVYDIDEWRCAVCGKRVPFKKIEELEVKKEPEKEPELDTMSITWKGKTQSITDWEKELGFGRCSLRHRIFSSGWTIEEAFTTPQGKHRVKHAQTKIKKENDMEKQKPEKSQSEIKTNGIPYAKVLKDLEDRRDLIDKTIQLLKEIWGQ